jgi:hypothetical protein
MEELDNALDLTIHQQRCSDVADEPFTFEKNGAGKAIVFLRQVVDMDDLTLPHRARFRRPRWLRHRTFATARPHYKRFRCPISGATLGAPFDRHRPSRCSPAERISHGDSPASAQAPGLPPRFVPVDLSDTIPPAGVQTGRVAFPELGAIVRARVNKTVHELLKPDK